MVGKTFLDDIVRLYNEMLQRWDYNSPFYHIKIPEFDPDLYKDKGTEKYSVCGVFLSFKVISGE